MITQLEAKYLASKKQRRVREHVPSREECRVLWSRFGVSDEVVAHSETVAELARILAIHLDRAGIHLDVGLVVAAGLLHDLDRGAVERAEVSAGLLLNLGYPSVAKAVAYHAHKTRREAMPVDESDLIHLADRLLWWDRPMPLDEQTDLASDLYAPHSVQFDALSRHLKEAGDIRDRVESLLHCAVDDLLHRHRKGLQAASVRGPRDIYLVRAGAAPRSGSGGRPVEDGDIPLSPEGMLQAEALSQELEKVPFAAVYCSDSRSSVDTARTIAGPHHLNPRICEGLRELGLGEWESLSPGEIIARYPVEAEKMRCDRLDYRPPKGESYMDCALRVIPSFLEILHGQRGNLVIVAHENVNRIILCQAVGLPMEKLFDFEQDSGCWNVIGVKDAGYELKTVNYRPSLGQRTMETARAADFLAGIRAPRAPRPGNR